MEVDVYWNTHKKMWSVRDKIHSRIIFHTPSIRISLRSWQISKAGQQRVRKTKKKNVHAWLTGCILPLNKLSNSNKGEGNKYEKLSYNPYKDDEFMVGRKPLSKSRIESLTFCQDGTVLAKLY